MAAWDTHATAVLAVTGVSTGGRICMVGASGAVAHADRDDLMSALRATCAGSDWRPLSVGSEHVIMEHVQPPPPLRLDLRFVITVPDENPDSLFRFEFAPLPDEEDMRRGFRWTASASSCRTAPRAWPPCTGFSGR